MACGHPIEKRNSDPFYTFTPTLPFTEELYKGLNADANRLLLETVQKHHPDAPTLYEWNDWPATTHAEVMEVFNETIAALPSPPKPLPDPVEHDDDQLELDLVHVEGRELVYA